jgi:DNA-binding winged helix-turn-helix (wHTH) protein/Flp pilus assembly protein TadD
MRTSPGGPAEILEFGRFQLFPDGRFLRDGRRVPLSPKEWAVLRVLASAAGSLVAKDDLIAQVWPGETVSDASLVRAIYGLRRRLGLTEAGDEYIATSYGRGYWLNAPVHSAPRQKRSRPAADAARLPSRARPVPQRAVEACHEARYHFRKRNVGRIKEAIRLYRLAAEWAPSYGPAHIGLVKCFLSLTIWTAIPREEGLASAGAALDAAAALEPDNPEVLALRAFAASAMHWQFPEAEALFERALRRADEPSDVLLFYGRHCILAGDGARAAAALERFVDNDPLSPPALAALGYARFCGGQDAEALAATRQALALDGRSTEALAHLAVISMHAGRRQEASAAGQRAYRQAPAIAPVNATWAYLCACDGRQDEARRVMEKAAASAYRAPACMAIAAWALGDAGETAAWVRKAVKTRCMWLPVVCHDPRFAAALEHQDVAAALAGSPFAPRPVGS